MDMYGVRGQSHCELVGLETVLHLLFDPLRVHFRQVARRRQGRQLCLELDVFLQADLQLRALPDSIRHVLRVEGRDLTIYSRHN
jgi:hypothetical protein